MHFIKNNSTNNCFLLEKTIKGFIKKFEELSSLQIKPKDIYIFVFINQLIKNGGNLVTKKSLSNLNQDNPFLKMPLKPKDENRTINIDLICKNKKNKMSEVKSLNIYYNYILNKLRKEK